MNDGKLTNLAGLTLRNPTSEDGYSLNQLVAKCPPLDKNSTYCNLLQCTHFAQTSVAATLNNQLVGFISAYFLPGDPKTIFVWQVVVDETMRGCGIAKRMLNWLIDLPVCKNALRMYTTITLTNGPSRALFESFARDCKANITESVLFKHDIHFAGEHSDEYLYCLAPLPNRPKAAMSKQLGNFAARLRLPNRKRWID